MRVLEARRSSSGKQQSLQRSRGDVPPQQANTGHATLVAPLRGWILDENLAATQPAGAIRLDNWLPTLTGIRMRKGSPKYATIGNSPVESMFVYRSGSIEKLFAATETAVYDITNPADPAVLPVPEFSGQTSGRYSTELISTPGGDFLVAVNGTDDARLYNGTNWSVLNAGSAPAVSGVDTSNLSFVWKFSSRLFFIEKDTANVWYLPVDNVGGLASRFPLQSILEGGGALLFGGTWSTDSGDGKDDQIVFTTTTGAVAVYSGTDPLTDFSIVGRYQITPPRGYRALTKVGGDLIIATDEGLVPLSQAVQRSDISLSLNALSKAIEPEWQRQAVKRKTASWQIERWPENNLAIVTLPSESIGLENECLAVNLETNAWSRITGWDARCIVYFNGRMLFGDGNGAVFLMDVGGNDNGIPFTASCVWLPDNLGAPGVTKTVHSARGIFRAATPFQFKITASVNHQEENVAAPGSGPEFTSGTWDNARFDQETWDAGAAFTVRTQWVSIGRTGFSVLPQIQVTSGTQAGPEVELISTDLIYENGAVMV